MASLADSYHMVPRHPPEKQDFTLYPDHASIMTTTSMDMHSLPAEAYSSYPRSTHEATLGSPLTYVDPSLYSEPNYMFNSKPSPVMYQDNTDMRASSSNISTASAPSSASSTVSSPQSAPSHATTMAEWNHNGLAITPNIVGQNDYFPGHEYGYHQLEDMHHFPSAEFTAKGPGYVGESQRVSCHGQSPRYHQGSVASTGSIDSGNSIVTVSPDASGPFTIEDTVSPVSFGSSQALASRRNSLTFPSPISTFSSSPFSSPVAAGYWPAVSPASVASSFFAQSSGHFVAPLSSPSCRFPSIFDRPAHKSLLTSLRGIDPSLIHHHELSRPMVYHEAYSHPNSAYPVSPALSASPQPPAMRHETQSPFVNAHYPPYSPYQPPSETARIPAGNFMSPPTENWESPDSKEKQRCTCPECGKVFKDLKAHMLTHQNERPEKCPIGTCEYHVKGFARKYDKNRHTLTHYKGTMVCGFCPGSGSAAEKSFNRADVFKRHLTAVHAVEQTPPNARKKQGAAGARKLTTNYPPDATGKCSTCSQTFANAQEFYEHLDDCVLRIVQQEDPAEAINAKRLAEVENDKKVAQTLEKNNLSTTTMQAASTSDDEKDDEMSDVDDEYEITSPITKSPTKPGSPKRKSNPASGVQKTRGMTHSRGGVAVAIKKGGRKNRRDYPSSWGFDKGQLTMKKRVVTVFDGTHRLVKDDMMLSTENEVRIQLADGKSYVTDLDVLTLQRAEAYHNADEEKASWVTNDPTKEQIKHAQALMAGNISPALTARSA